MDNKLRLGLSGFSYFNQKEIKEKSKNFSNLKGFTENKSLALKSKRNIVFKVLIF